MANRIILALLGLMLITGSSIFEKSGSIRQAMFACTGFIIMNFAFFKHD